MKKFGIFTLLLAMLLTWAQAQTFNMTISGTVTDINGGAPVPNYPVDIMIDSSNFLGWAYVTTVNTDINGNYTHTVAVPMGIGNGTGRSGIRDCTPTGYFVNNFTFTNGTSSVPNLNFQICTSTMGGCQAAFSSNWIQGSTVVAFTDLSVPGTGNITSWAWDFGSGTSSQQNPTFAFNAMGSYVVCLTITTSTGCTDTYCDSVTLGGTTINCSASLSGSTSPQGVTTFAATGSGTGTPVAYYYDFGDGNVATGGSTINHTYTTNGTYTACVTVSFSDSCVATSCTNVTIGNTIGCQAGFFWYPDTTGQYSIIVVNTSVGQNPSYLWTFGDGSSSTQAYPQHTYAGPGTYVVCVTVTDSNCTNTYCDSLIVVNKVSTPFTINVIASGASAVTPAQPTALEVSLYPNPAHSHLKVEVSLEQSAPVAVSLMDLSGKLLMNQSLGECNAGKHELQLNTLTLPTGLYLARVNVGGIVSSHKVVVAH